MKHHDHITIIPPTTQTATIPGVGLQFGLEVANFMFIIQTNEGMEHFKRGGNII